MPLLKDVDKLMGLDFESSGVNVDTARIVTVCYGTYTKGESDPWDFNTTLVNPGIEIPQGAIDIHGITNEKAATGEDPKVMLPKLVDFIYAGWEQGIPLVGHNIGSYDLNLLNAELVRNGFGQLKISGPILDTCDMFRMCGHKKAKLEIATAYYGIVNRGAHDAKWDVVASIELLFAMMKESTLMRETSLRDAYTQQKVGHRMWAQDMRAFFIARGKQFDSSDDWPVFKKWEQK